MAFHFFMFIIDAAAQNSFALFKLQNQNRFEKLRGWLKLILINNYLGTIAIFKHAKSNWKIWESVDQSKCS
jgi:hypothetical protein